MPRPIHATIHTDALHHNLARVRQAVPDAKTWAVIKANAYGHGIERAFEGLRAADGFALLDLAEAERVRQKWEQWGDGVRLMIVESSYRRFMEPLLLYIDEIYQRKQPNEVITIVVPMFVSHKRATEILHTNTADALREALMFRKGIVITNVPYLID